MQMSMPKYSQVFSQTLHLGENAASQYRCSLDSGIVVQNV